MDHGCRVDVTQDIRVLKDTQPSKDEQCSRKRRERKATDGPSIVGQHPPACSYVLTRTVATANMPYESMKQFGFAVFREIECGEIVPPDKRERPRQRKCPQLLATSRTQNIGISVVQNHFQVLR